MKESLTNDEQMHTPGPWKVIPPGHGHPTEYQCVQFGADEMYTSLEMLPADARLCAAAPDLLALCRSMKQWLEPELVKEPDRTYFWKLVEVIRKAEGKEPLFQANKSALEQSK